MLSDIISFDPKYFKVSVLCVNLVSVTEWVYSDPELLLLNCR